MKGLKNPELSDYGIIKCRPAGGESFDRLRTSCDVLKLRPGITGPATLKYRLEDEMISEYVAKKQAEGNTRPMQEIATEYNDTVIYPDKVRLNCYYYRHYYRGSKGLSSLIGLKCLMKDIEMIFATVLGRKIEFAGERF